MQQQSTQPASQERQSDLLDLLIVLARRKNLIFGIPLLTALTAAGVSMVLPVYYKANVRLLPPQQAQSGAAALLAQLGGVAGAAAGAAGIKNPNDLYMGMLRSRRVADSLIGRFDLKKVYDTESQEKARKILDRNTLILSGKDNLINIEVEDTGKQRVVHIANAYAEELLKLTRQLALTEAAQRRLFFERQLSQTKDNLAAAELLLKGNLERGGVISVDSDSRAVVETVGRLRAQIAAKEVQIRAMHNFVTGNNVELQRAQSELAGMKTELNKLQNGSADYAKGSANGGKGGLENIKTLRDVKYHQMLYELLAKQYEVARLDEAKEASIIQVLDVAVEPERKSRPRRALIVIMCAAIALILTISFVIGGEMLRRGYATGDSSARLAKLRSHLGWRRKTR